MHPKKGERKNKKKDPSPNHKGKTQTGSLMDKRTNYVPKHPLVEKNI
jgi:hypothetical protein